MIFFIGLLIQLSLRNSENIFLRVPDTRLHGSREIMERDFPESRAQFDLILLIHLEMFSGLLFIFDSLFHYWHLVFLEYADVLP